MKQINKEDKNFFELHPDDDPIKWKNLVQSATLYPEHAAIALKLIKRMMGHTPKQLIYIPHEPFIRAHIESYIRGTISNEEYFNLVAKHVRDIRNDFMRLEKKYNIYNEKDFFAYESKAEKSKHVARNRLSNLLGYVPDVQHSLEGELLLRRAIDCKLVHVLDDYCDIDFKAAAITNYRMVYFTYGKQAADNSELMGLARNIKPIFFPA